MVLVVDNSGFSACIIASMARALGHDAMVVPDSLDAEYVRIMDYESVILSPGPGAGAGERLSGYLVSKNMGVPLLGLCSSMHLIAEAHGGAVTRCGALFSEDTLSHTGEGLFREMPQRFRVVLRQTHVIEKKSLPIFFDAQAYSSDGAIQGFSIPAKQLYGAGFDPSSCRAEHGKWLLHNFLSTSKKLQ